MKDFRVTAYDERFKQGLVRHVFIRYGFVSREVMVCLIVNGRRLPHEEELVKRIREISGVKSILLNVNRDNTNVILGEETRTLWGADMIEDALHFCTIPDFKRAGEKILYQISLKSFYQVNPMQTEKLYSLVLHGICIVELGQYRCFWQKAPDVCMG